MSSSCVNDRVVALCNFCEVHGPRIVFVCQETSSRNGRSRTGGKQFYGDISQNLLDFYSMADGSVSIPSTILSEVCDGCGSFNTSKPAYLTNDHERRISYTGCQYPFGADLFSRARGACVRSLSCEACPGRQGPILFGDTANGYCLSYVFTLRDSKARGFQHSYSIVVVSRHLDALIQNYVPLVASLKEVVSRLQSWSNSVFEREGEESADRMPQIAASGRASWMPSGFFLRSNGEPGSCRTIAAPRSLKALTNRVDIFGILHDVFTNVHRLASGEISLGLNDLYCSLISGPSVESSQVDGFSDGARIVDSRHHICAACSVASSPTLSFRTLLLIYDILGSEAFSILAYHLLIGDQIVVRSSCACLNRILLDALKLLLPPHCVKCVESSKEYLESWECNLVGLLVETSNCADSGDKEYPQKSIGGGAKKQLGRFPLNSITGDACVILCVESSESATCHDGVKNGKNCHGTYLTSGNKKDRLKNFPWDTYHFRMFCTAAAASNNFFDFDMPALLHSLLNLFSRTFSRLYSSEDGILAGINVLECLKDEWLKKAKLYYVVSKRCDDKDGSWRSSFFRVSKCTLIDEPVLKFWKSGLDRRFKQSVLVQYAARRSWTFDKSAEKRISNGNVIS